MSYDGQHFLIGDTLSDAYTVQRTHTKTKTKPSYVPATFRDQKQMSVEGSDA